LDGVRIDVQEIGQPTAQ